VFERGELGDWRRNFSGEGVVREVEDGEAVESADIGGDLAGEFVSDEVENAEGGEGGDAGRDLAGDVLPVSDDEGGEGVDAAYCRRDFAGHVAGATGFLEDWVLRLAAEVDVGDAAGGGIAADAVPVDAAVGARPRVEQAEVGLVQRLAEAQKRLPIRLRATAGGGHYGGENGRCK